MAGTDRPCWHSLGTVPEPLPQVLVPRAFKHRAQAVSNSFWAFFRRASLGLAHFQISPHAFFVARRRGAWAQVSCCSLRAELKPAENQHDRGMVSPWQLDKEGAHVVMLSVRTAGEMALIGVQHGIVSSGLKK
jgi:hypothetical protein